MAETNLAGTGPFALNTNTNATSYSDDQPDDFQRKSITSYSEVHLRVCRVPHVCSVVLLASVPVSSRLLSRSRQAASQVAVVGAAEGFMRELSVHAGHR